jgi:hypothetical protein
MWQPDTQSGIVFLEFVFINAPQFAIEKTKTL